MNLTEHFTYEEAIFSQTAIRMDIDNTPSLNTLVSMVHTAIKMEEVRSLLRDLPITITSWYRSPKINAALGSKATSQHILGLAVDFICPAFGSVHQICTKLVQEIETLQFDQLISEGTWVHISFLRIPNTVSRKEVLTYQKDGKYVIGLYELSNAH